MAQKRYSNEDILKLLRGIELKQADGSDVRAAVLVRRYAWPARPSQNDVPKGAGPSCREAEKVTHRAWFSPDEANWPEYRDAEIVDDDAGFSPTGPHLPEEHGSGEKADRELTDLWR